MFAMSEAKKHNIPEPDKKIIEILNPSRVVFELKTNNLFQAYQVQQAKLLNIIQIAF